MGKILYASMKGGSYPVITKVPEGAWTSAGTVAAKAM